MKLGDEAKDKLTGFEGIVTAQTQYLYSSGRVQIQPKAMDGTKPVEPEWFDEDRVVVKVSDDNAVKGFRYE